MKLLLKFLFILPVLFFAILLLLLSVLVFMLKRGIKN